MSCELPILEDLTEISRPQELIRPAQGEGSILSGCAVRWRFVRHSPVADSITSSGTAGFYSVLSQAGLSCSCGMSRCRAMHSEMGWYRVGIGNSGP
jgi:hypothetical protein